MEGGDGTPAWTAEEDDLLSRLVGDHGPHNWATLARRFPGRTDDAIKNRWNNMELHHRHENPVTVLPLNDAEPSSSRLTPSLVVDAGAGSGVPERGIGADTTLRVSSPGEVCAAAQESEAEDGCCVQIFSCLCFIFFMVFLVLDVFLSNYYLSQLKDKLG